MPRFIFEGAARWRSETESDIVIKDKHVTVVSPPPEFGGKLGYLVPEEVFAASPASCMNTLFLLTARNSRLGLKKLETKAVLEMDAEGLDKLIFTNIYFLLTIALERDIEQERKKANSCYQIAQRTCPIRQSWGEKVPVTFQMEIQ